MIFKELKYLYKGTSDYQKDREFYLKVLGAALIWEFVRFGTKVVAFQLGTSNHLTLIADHLAPNKQILIYRAENLIEAMEILKSRGLKFTGSTFEIPDGTCVRFEDESSTQYGLYEKAKPDLFLTEEYHRQQAEKTVTKI